VLFFQPVVDLTRITPGRAPWIALPITGQKSIAGSFCGCFGESRIPDASVGIFDQRPTCNTFEYLLNNV
jgi:hypothetical protein